MSIHLSRATNENKRRFHDIRLATISRRKGTHYYRESQGMTRHSHYRKFKNPVAVLPLLNLNLSE